MNIDLLLERFPSHERIDKEKVRELLTNIFDNCECYQDIYDYIKKYIDECFPGSDENTYKWDSPEYKEYDEYVYGDKFFKWVEWLQDDFLVDKGIRRTYEEACHLAADKWCEMLFKHHVQDNGAINENHSGGFIACALATKLKDNSMEKITEEMEKSARENLYEFYRDHCYYVDNDGWEGHVNPYCDYSPNTPLYELLKKSGIPEDLITSICPWKTGILIDDKDNAVVVTGYQKRTYL